MADLSAALAGLGAFLQVADEVAVVNAKLENFSALSTHALVLRQSD